MSEISHELELIGLTSERAVTLKEAKRCFRRKSHLLLPEKSLGAPNAHGRFEELNNAFVRVLKYLRDNNGDSIEEIVPGEVDVKKAMFVIKLKKGSVPFWRRVIRSVYPTVIIGAQKKINFIPGAQGRAVRFVVYWKGGLEGSLQQYKVNLVLYENELLQVSGSGFFLWTMDNYQVSPPGVLVRIAASSSGYNYYSIWPRTSPGRWRRRCWSTCGPRTTRVSSPRSSPPPGAAPRPRSRWWSEGSAPGRPARSLSARRPPSWRTS